MDFINKFFPLSVQGKDDIVRLLIIIAIYALVPWVCSLLAGILIWIPVLGLLFALSVNLIRVYCAIGIVIALLVFLKVIK